MLQALQRSAGNAAASAYVQRLAESPGPVTSAAVSPQNDPRFQAVAAKVVGEGRRLRQHPPPRVPAQEAADAAAPPDSAKDARAKAAQVDTMNTAKPGGFDKAAFIKAVKKALAEQAPKTLDDADKYSESGRAEVVKAEVAGKVTEGKDASAQDIAEKTEAEPPSPKTTEKTITPLRAEPQPRTPRVNTAAAMPAPVPADRLDLSSGKQRTDTAMAEAGVTEEQLANSNEPQFTDALVAKKASDKHADVSPAAVRTKESAHLEAATQEAQSTGAAGLMKMVSTKKDVLGRTAAQQTAAKSQDEAERARIAGEIKTIFDATKSDVTAILNGLDAKVEQQFGDGEKSVREAFTADLNARMAEYKRERYSGAGGDILWAKDELLSLPEEANKCYTGARRGYEKNMGALIERVANTISSELGRAKQRISKGRADIETYVRSQPKTLRKLAQEASAEFADQFDQLENDVDAKKNTLVDNLASKYAESRTAVDAEITSMKEENKGFVDVAAEALEGVGKTVLQLKGMLSSVLARAAGAVDKIITDPIGFLDNFVRAVKSGVLGFRERIIEHLKDGLQTWLLGSLSAAGIELPDKLDLKDIVGLVLSLLGLTWPSIRARIAKRVPEKAMAGVERSVDFIQVILSEGVGGLWKWVVEKLGDVKEMVMGQIRELVITKIVKAGITWLISMLNPAAAFIKACQMIYAVVMFFVERAAQIKEFVDAVLDSVESLAGGGAGAVADHIEKTLAKMVPVLIGFFANLLRMGDIPKMIREIFRRIQKPVGQVVDNLVGMAVKSGRRIYSKLTDVGTKAANRARERARAVAEKIGIVRTPIMTNGEHHTLSIDPRKGAVYLASKTLPFEHQVDVQIKKRRAQWQAEGRPTDSIEKFAAHVKSRVSQIKKAIRASKKSKGQIARSRLSELRKFTVDLLTMIGPHPGGPKDACTPEGLGQIKRHGDQGDRNRSGTPIEVHLQSEHIIPVGMVSILLREIGQPGIERNGSEDKYMHTIMIYRLASEIKDNAGLKSDWNQINVLKSISIRGRPYFEGRGKHAMSIRSRGQDVREKVFLESEQKKGKIKSELLSKLPGIFAGRVTITNDAIKADHLNLKDNKLHTKRNHDEPLPREEGVRTAATLQAEDIIDIIMQRM